MTKKIVTIIEARPQTLSARLILLWQYRNFYGFIFKEITMRKFRDTVLGFWWLAIRPLIPALIFILMFTIHPMDTGNEVPYPIFFLSGFLTWNIFNSTLIFMPRTLLWMQGIMRRTYFPRLLIPLASFGPPLVEFIVIFTVFFITVCFYWAIDQFPLHLGWQLLFIIPCFFMSLLFGLSLGMMTSVIALFFRDIVFSIAYFAQIFMFLTPVIYPMTYIPKNYHWLVYILNPMAKLVETSRWSLLGIGSFDSFYFFTAMTTVLCLFIVSVIFFFRAETYLADQF